MVNLILHKQSKKVTIHELQKLCGFLNFLGCAIVPGRAFTRRLYYYMKLHIFKPHHHVRVNYEMRKDLETWACFLQEPTVFSRPFLDFSSNLTAELLDMYSDAAKHPELGFGATCGKSWMFGLRVHTDEESKYRIPKVFCSPGRCGSVDK